MKYQSLILLLKLTLLYLSALLVLTGLVKLFLKAFKRDIPFGKMFRNALIAALAGNMVSYFIYNVYTAPGFYWGELPKSTVLTYNLIGWLPVAVVFGTLVWTVRRLSFKV